MAQALGGQERSQRRRYTILEEMLAAGAGGGPLDWRSPDWPPLAPLWNREQNPLSAGDGPRKCSFAIGMSEPDSGSDLASIRTHAAHRRRLVVSGTKVWTSHAQRSRYCPLVRTAPLASEGSSVYANDHRPHGHGRTSSSHSAISGEGISTRWLSATLSSPMTWWWAKLATAGSKLQPNWRTSAAAQAFLSTFPL